VIIVVLIFIQEWHAVLLPIFNIVVALVGTFAIMAAMGFSLNNLSLFGLVLAVGIVVDDSIVLVENIERWMATGLGPREATLKAMDEITGPVIGITLVLSSIFIPTAFMPGLTGQFFRQFALTIAFSAILSATNVLTTLPAVAALVLKPRREDAKGEVSDAMPTVAYAVLAGYVTARLLVDFVSLHLKGVMPTGKYSEQLELAGAWGLAALPGLIIGGFLARPIHRAFGFFFRMFNKGFDTFTNRYSRLVGVGLQLSLIVLILYAGLVGLTGYGIVTSPTGFIPEQDQGYLLVNVELPDAASVQRTSQIIT